MLEIWQNSEVEKDTVMKHELAKQNREAWTVCDVARKGRAKLLQAGSDGQVAVLAIRPSHTCTERKIFHSEQEVGCPRTISRAHSFPTIDLLLYNNNDATNTVAEKMKRYSIYASKAS